MNEHLNSQQHRIPALVMVVAVSLILFSFANIVVLGHLQEPTARLLVPWGIHFLLTGVLAHYLWSGRSWARKVTIGLAVVSVAISLFLLTTLPPGFTPFELAAGLCVSAMFYGGIACTLIFSSTVKAYFAGPQFTVEYQEVSAWAEPATPVHFKPDAEG